jgi:hypothetical protein
MNNRMIAMIKQTIIGVAALLDLLFASSCLLLVLPPRL